MDDVSKNMVAVVVICTLLIVAIKTGLLQHVIDETNKFNHVYHDDRLEQFDKRLGVSIEETIDSDKVIVNNHKKVTSNELTELAKEEDLKLRKQQVEEFNMGLARQIAVGEISVEYEKNFNMEPVRYEGNYKSPEQIQLEILLEDLKLRKQQMECERDALIGIARILSK